ncbi:hypothetical protein CEXT_394601 [Caerostris extrusa]|uniref:Uncharacterized protein n=1 Tax=Caerostris extrusa TaxID=172846 RepID=A0AAV4VKI4_CAEEX|nr:hypothetical protein CEXT_394601 [Caerostris extrusa]
MFPDFYPNLREQTFYASLSTLAFIRVQIHSFGCMPIKYQIVNQEQHSTMPIAVRIYEAFIAILSEFTAENDYINLALYIAMMRYRSPVYSTAPTN